MKSKAESEIESNFIYHLAQLSSDEENALGNILGDDGGAGENKSDDALGGDEDAADDLGPDDGDGGLPMLDTDMDEAQAVKNLITWDSFVIIFDPHYAKLLIDTINLPEPKAKAKSFYIYFSPENKRLEGIVNKRYVGGYDEKEKLGEDFEFLKNLSPEGFPPDWKKKLLTDIDQLPAVENQKIKEELEFKSEKEEEEEEQEPKEELTVPEVPEEGGGAEQPAAEQPKPEPVGKVNTQNMQAPASLNSLRLRRFARLSSIKKIKKEGN